jgi:hypothetical protein
MSAIHIAQIFLPQCVTCKERTEQPVTWWATIIFIRYSMVSLIDRIFSLKENKALISSMSAAIWSCSVVFYAWWLFLLPQCVIQNTRSNHGNHVQELVLLSENTPHWEHHDSGNHDNQGATDTHKVCNSCIIKTNKMHFFIYFNNLSSTCFE